MTVMESTSMNQHHCSEPGGKGLVELETLYQNIKLKVAKYIHNSKYQHINLVKSFPLKKEESHLSSIFKHAKKYSDELNIECEFDDGATIIQAVTKKYV